MGSTGTARRFRPIRWRGLWWFGFGLPFALFAAFAPCGSMEPGGPGWWLGVGMTVSAGICCVLAPAVTHMTSVTVGPTGLAKAASGK